MTNGEKEKYLQIIRNKKIPPISLDNKWHQLFPKDGKPEVIAYWEEEVNACIKREGSLNTDLKDLKKLKTKLMDSIVANMDVAESRKQLKKMEENQRLILEINEKISRYEEELTELPKRQKDATLMLMLETMDYCYSQMRENQEMIEEIESWIKEVRIELKKNVVRKQDKEILNNKMYSYLHDLFGVEVVSAFDYYETKKNKDNLG